MASPSPTIKSLLNIKHQLLRPALTSHFQCWFNPPQAVREWAIAKEKAGSGASYSEELFSLLCSETSLPGSSLATIDIDNDYHGVSQKNAYRRIYDDRIDFTFYVDLANKNSGNNYTIIQFFENWISYIVNEQFTENPNIQSPNYTYRVKYPRPDKDNKGGYKSPAIYVNKFERDFKGRFLQYRLIQAFPIAINSMPISYDQSQLLKCTVSFNYERYLVTTNPNLQVPGNSEPTPAPPPGIPTQNSSITLLNSTGTPQVTRTLDLNRPTLAQLNE